MRIYFIGINQIRNIRNLMRIFCFGIKLIFVTVLILTGMVRGDRRRELGSKARREKASWLQSASLCLRVDDVTGKGGAALMLDEVLE